MSEEITLTINDRTVTVPKGILLIEAAGQAGIEIPVFCYHPKLKPVGACRMCLVEIEKMPRLQAACTTPATAGMVVHTDTANVVHAQNGVIELLLANHPLDCPICDKGGECPLQENTMRFGLGTSRFTEEKRRLDKAFPLSDRIVLDRERCIMCLRCVRFQREIPGDEALAILNRAGRSEVGTLPGETFDSPFSGNTIEICPVGALTSRQYRFRARPWEITRTPSVCVGCAVGCNVELHSRDGTILRIVSHENPEVDGGWLCDYGRFDTLPPTVSDLTSLRPQAPSSVQARSAGEPVPPLPNGRFANPEDGAMHTKERIAEPLIRENDRLRPAAWEEALDRAVSVLRSGSSGVLASPSLTNEAIWTLAHRVLPGLGAGARGACWPAVSTSWQFEGEIANLPGCRSVVIVGLDPWRELPVLALWLRKAVLQGGRLVVIGASNGLYRDTAHWLKGEAGHEVETTAALLRSLEGATSGVDEAVKAAAVALDQRPAAVLAGPEVVQDAAGRAVLDRLAELLGADPATGGVRGSPALAANGRGVGELAPGLAGRPGDGSTPFGDTPSSLLLVGDEAWPETGSARLVLLAGQQTPVSHRGAAAVVSAGSPVLERETLDVVLPLTHLYEQTGAITNLAGRVQSLKPGGLAPRLALPDWAALARLATAFDRPTPDSLPRLREEMANGRESKVSSPESNVTSPESVAGGRG